MPVSFFNKVVGLRPVTLLKKSLWHRCFPVILTKFLRTSSLLNTSYGCFWTFKQNLLFKLRDSKQNQSSRGALTRRCSENMQQFYMRTTMPKCDFNTVAKQLTWNRTSAWVFSWRFVALFSEHLFLRTPLKGCFCPNRQSGNMPS